MSDEILLKIQADIKDLKSKLKEIEGKFSDSGKKIGKNADNINKKFQNMGNLMKAVFAAAIIRKFVQGLNSCVKAASDLEEQTAKFKTVFRGSLDVADKAVKDLTKSYAMSTREAREHLAAIQDLLVPMDIARDRAADFSGEIVKLAADIGSFNNLPTQQVMWDIESALTGQYRTMRKYGIVLFDTTVKQKALNMGLAKTEDELTAGDKALAAYQLMLKSSADAQGDMARTADSYANASKRANAAMEEFKSVLGQQIMPAMGFWKSELTKIITLTTEVIKLYSKEEAAPATMLDFIRQDIAKTSREMEKYKAIMESSWRTMSEKQSAEETYNQLLERRARRYEQLAKFKKAGKDIDYTTEDDIEKAKQLNEELKRLEETVKRMNEEKLQLEPIFEGTGWREEMYDWEKEFAKAPEHYIDENLKKLMRIGEVTENTAKSQDKLNNAWGQTGVQAVYDLGRAIDIVFSRAENKAEQLRQTFFSLLGFAVGMIAGGGNPTWGGIGASIGSGIGGLFSPSTSGVGDRSSIELSNQVINSKSYSAYKIGV